MIFFHVYYYMTFSNSAHDIDGNTWLCFDKNTIFINFFNFNPSLLMLLLSPLEKGFWILVVMLLSESQVIGGSKFLFER